MNITVITHETFAETICGANVLTTLEGPGAAQSIICEHDGADIIIIMDPLSGTAIVVHPCSQDSESGGSIHDHARAAVL